MDGETIETYAESGKGLVWFLWEMTTDKQDEVIHGKKDLMFEVGQNAALEEYNAVWIDTVQFKEDMEGMFGVKEYPQVVVQKKAGEQQYWKMPLDGDITKDQVIDYVKKVSSGEIEPHIKSEDDPEGGVEQKGAPVKVVTGKLME